MTVGDTERKAIIVQALQTLKTTTYAGLAANVKELVDRGHIHQAANRLLKASVFVAKVDAVIEEMRNEDDNTEGDT